MKDSGASKNLDFNRLGAVLVLLILGGLMVGLPQFFHFQRYLARQHELTEVTDRVKAAGGWSNVLSAARTFAKGTNTYWAEKLGTPLPPPLASLSPLFVQLLPAKTLPPVSPHTNPDHVDATVEVQIFGRHGVDGPDEPVVSLYLAVDPQISPFSPPLDRYHHTDIHLVQSGVFLVY